MIQRIAIGFVLFCLAQLSLADEIRPGYLEIKENSENIFSVLWKVPAKGNKKLSLLAQLPANCVNKTQANTQFINASYIQRWITTCEGGLVDQSISIAGLESTSTDVILQLEFISGVSQSTQLTPTKNSYTVPAEASSLQIVSTYTKFGIEHILMGVDHLLFVFALLLIVGSTRKLVITITAFTLAHSITLGAATLGFVHVPQQPVEAVIALSILFLAVEIVHGKQGRQGYAARWPWLVAFVFGLLHGFGFAGALAEIGLPQQAIPLALVFFNVGVELGQLLFVSGIVLLTWLLHKLNQQKLVSRAETAVVYSIGGLASFWLFERISLF
jgi:hydrogenase/urease accessory protein HupE